MFNFLFFIFLNYFSQSQVSGDFGGAGGGAVRVGGAPATTCSAATLGALKYESGDGSLYYCDGNNWTMAITDPCAGSLPNNWDFTDLTGQNLLTSVTSSIHQITNIAACTVPVKVSTNIGSVEYRVCDDGACATVSQDWSSSQRTITNNKYVQLRLTTSSAASTTSVAAITVGDRVESWNVSTTSDCASSEPSVGSFCADGTIYIGRGPDGGTKVYTTPCLPGGMWDGSQCVGALRTEFLWARNATVSTGNTGFASGAAATANLAGLSNADSPYGPMVYCQNLTLHGKSDWYVPSIVEANLFQSGCGMIPDATCNSARYWSSTEVSATGAYYYMKNSTGGTSTNKANSNYPTRCIRKD